MSKSRAPTATEIVVRPMRRRDIPGFVELRHHVWADDITTAESYAWLIDRETRADQARRWVATERGRVVGIASALRATWFTGDVAQCHVAVLAPLRGGGIGRRLAAEVERHLARIAPAQTICGTERGDEPSAAFARNRGFRPSREDRAWSLDPRTVPMADFAERRAAAEAAGLRLATLRELLGRPRDLHRLIVALEGDLPSDVPIASPYEDWVATQLGSPLFSPEASFCLLAGDEPVALTWISLDAPHGRAGHGITGTLPAWRHRGLARLVKLASIGWLAEHGVTTLFTDNDAENRDMLALNEHLGYRPLTVFEIWKREAPSPPA
jgi:GNAT superfamily N-acetyltransferase